MYRRTRLQGARRRLSDFWRARGYLPRRKVSHSEDGVTWLKRPRRKAVTGTVILDSAEFLRVTVESEVPGSIALRSRGGDSMVTVANSTTVTLGATDIDILGHNDVFFVSDGVSRRVKASVVDPRARVQESLASQLAILEGHRTAGGWLSLRADRIAQRLELVTFVLSDAELILTVDAIPGDLEFPAEALIGAKGHNADFNLTVPAQVQQISQPRKSARYRISICTADLMILALRGPRAYSVSLRDATSRIAQVGAQSCTSARVTSLTQAPVEIPLWGVPSEEAYDYPYRTCTIAASIDRARWFSLRLVRNESASHYDIYPAGRPANLSY